MAENTVTELQETPLTAIHRALGAKMGAFAGYDMPLYYGPGVLKEHLWTRQHAGLFDVSHMGQIKLSGAGVVAFLERLTPSGFANARIFAAKYTCLLNEDGGIIDDLIVTRMADGCFFAVINAGCKDKDIAWIKQNLPEDVTLEVLSENALIALQGPESEAVLRDVLKIETLQLAYMHLLQQGDYMISRLGYTGEDGFEISLPKAQAQTIWNKLNAHPSVEPIGLAARDSLRLEMGYCLYGHDIDATTSPLEAGLGWVVRKEGLDCIGSARLVHERAHGVERKRVGVRLLDKGVAREGAELLDDAGNTIGVLTSGGFGPSVDDNAGASVGQGYVVPSHAATGSKLMVKVRDRLLAAEIAAMPFVAASTRKAA